MYTPYNYILSPLWRVLTRLLLMVGILCLGVGVLRIQSINHDTKKNLLILVDTSRSMSVEDIDSSGGVIYSRLDAAKNLLHSLADHTPHALMTFTDVARLQIPFSTDRGFWDSFTESLSPSQSIVATDIDGALAHTALIYPDTALSVIVLTDGESTISSFSGLLSLPQTIDITFVGIGTEDGGKIIDRYDGDGNMVYKTYQGKEVISRLDMVGLSRLQDHYDAKLFTIKTIEDIVPVLESIEAMNISTPLVFQLDPFILLGAFMILFGLIFPDYRLK